MDLGIAGKVALVTGGARNLGRADALKLAEEGCRVAVVDLNREGAEETAAEIRGKGGQALAVECDIADRAAVRAAAGRIQRELGPVNMQVNLTGTYNGTKAVFPGMRDRRWGRVVCMASIAGLLGGFGQTAYSTTKMGVIGFAPSVALQGARHGITANVIAPGIIGEHTKLSPMYDRMVKRVAMQREGDPEDIANAIAFLCSERARYITGAVLTVTGGMDLFTF